MKSPNGASSSSRADGALSPAEATTIVAVATPPGKGAVAIVRASGPGVGELAAKLVRTKSALRERVATYATIVDERGEPLDRGLALRFDAPRSYTGEPMLELQVHGSPVVAREIVRAMLACGARLAAAGEFTQRAFFNGKLSLRAAAAVADVIDAQSRTAARAAIANFDSGLAREVRRLRAELRAALEELEGTIDFPDEVPEPERAPLEARLTELSSQLERIRRDGELGRLAREGLGVAIVGPPNAGKSSLLNALLGSDRAIVSELPGTTRDTIEENLTIDGMLVRLVDTAGIRAHADRLEASGIARSRAALDAAAVALLVVDGSIPPGRDALLLRDATVQRPRVIFVNKADLETDPAYTRDWPESIVGTVGDPATLERLRAAIAAAGWNGETFDATRPHLAALYEFDAVNAALEALANARIALAGGEAIDFVAGELQRAFSALGQVSEQTAAEEIVTGIFSRFCIGK